MTSAVVVGSGPNGLAAAIVLAQAGLDVTVLEAEDTIGGGMRSAEVTVPGLVHDLCSAAHPTGAASPFFASLGLEDHGLEWLRPEVEAVHLLDGGRGGVMHGDVETTALGLGPDADRWRKLFEPLVEKRERIVPDIFGPVLHVPQHPLDFAAFGARAGRSLNGLVRGWETDEARGLLAAFAAHVIAPMSQPSTAGIAMMFGMLGQSVGWPVAKGGSQSVADALVSVLEGLGGRIETGHRVTQMPDADVVMLDVTPHQVLALAGDRLPGHVRRSFGRWRRGPASFKIDLAVEGGVPWTNDDARRAGTLHLGGTLAEVDAAERAVLAGRMPERPFVLVCQQYLADPDRSVGDVHPVWAYAHVPHAYPHDATEAIYGQVERFAPGFRERVVASSVRTPADLEDDNANYLGGDITGGANTFGQTLFRPRPAMDPYRLTDRWWMCSSAAPPGGGVHGMAGFHAATRAVRRL